MKTIISEAAKDMIRKFDQELFSILREDVRNYRQLHQDNLINFNTRKIDMELQQLLKEELNNFKNNSRKRLAHVG